MDMVAEEVLSIVLSRLGHVRWLHATLAVSKLFKKLSLALLKQRTARLARGVFDEHELLGRVRTRSFTIVDEQYQTAYPRKIWQDSTGKLFGFVEENNSSTSNLKVIKLENVATLPIRQTKNGEMTSLHGSWKVEEPFRQAKPEFQYALPHDIFQSTDEDDEGFFWYNAKLSSRAFFMPKVNCLYIHRHRGTEKMGRANLDTGEIFFQESPVGMKDPSCIVVAPNGFQVASASTYCKVVEENNILHQVYMGVVSRYEAGMQGALHHLDELWMPGQCQTIHYVSETKLLCSWHRSTHPPVDQSFPLDRKIGKTGVQLLDFESQEIKNVVTSTGIHNEFAVFPDKRIICYTAGRPPYENHPHIVVYKNSAASLRKTSNFLFNLFEHDFEVEAAFGRDWWPNTDASRTSLKFERPVCYLIRPINNDMAVFSVAQHGLILVDVTKETQVVRFAGPEERMTRRIRSLNIAEDGRLVIHSGNFLCLVDAGVM